jgi:predicted nucleic acid-binding protein
MSYWDTSALVKLFVQEKDSPAFHVHAAGMPERLITAELTRLELWSALRRKEAEDTLLIDVARQLLSDFDLGCARSEWKLVPDSTDVRAEFERIVERCCSQTPPVFIRTLDSLHIASACAVGETEIVATDRRLREAATLLGFQLFPPRLP